MRYKKLILVRLLALFILSTSSRGVVSHTLVFKGGIAKKIAEDCFP